MRHPGLVFTFALVACSSSPEVPPPASAESAGMSGPLSLKVDGPTHVQAGETIAVTVRLSRRLITADPITLSLEIPPGIRLESGEVKEIIQDATTAEIVRTIKLFVQDVPTADLVVGADVRGAAWFAHGTAVYGFGRRPPPPAKKTIPIGPELKVRGVNMGPTIPLSVQQP